MRPSNPGKASGVRVRTHLIGVPPGVGDVYFALSKIKAYRNIHELEHVTLAIMKTRLDRSAEWKRMVGFIDDTRYVAFIPGAAERSGFERKPASAPHLDAIMWPNAIVDKGVHLDQWLPELGIADLNFEVKTEAVRDGDVVLYASSDGVNKAWFNKLPPSFWLALAGELQSTFGRKPLLVGSDWDALHCKPLRTACESLVGHTSLPQVAGILKSAKIVVGVISGLTILANHFRTPTIAFAPNKHHADFPYTWTRGESPYVVYRERDLEVESPASICAAAASIAR